MQYLCNRHGLDRFYPTEPGERAMVDSAMFYVVGTLYPLIARATYPTLGFPQYAGEVGTSRGRRRLKARAPRTPRPRSPNRLTPSARSSSTGGTFIGGERPSIADIRLPRRRSSSCASVDYPFPAWAEAYLAAMEAGARRGVLRAGGGRARLRRLRAGARLARPVIRVCVAGITGWTGTRRRRGGRARRDDLELVAGVVLRSGRPLLVRRRGARRRAGGRARRLHARGGRPRERPAPPSSAAWASLSARAG